MSAADSDRPFFMPRGSGRGLRAPRSPGVAHEKASYFALLGRDAGRPYPLAHCLDLLGVVEHHRPVAQTHPALRDWRHALSTPDVEAEVVVVAAGGHERGCAGHERLELEAEHVAVEA